jgi:magnesium transporter
MMNRPPRSSTGTSQLSSKASTDVPIEVEEEDYFDYFYNEPGSVPGTLLIEADAAPPVLFLIDYNEENATRTKLNTPEEVIPYLDSESVSWIDVQGLGSEDVLRRIGKVFGLHPLVLEDIVNVPQRPKVEEYEKQLLIVLRMVTPREDGKRFISEQVSFILGEHYLLTVQEEPDYDPFGPVRERIRSNKGMICRHHADFLTYALIDAIVDGFFPVLEAYGDELEELEDEVVENPSRATLERIHQVKRDLLGLRRAIWPQREVINSLLRDGTPLIGDTVRTYLRDCYDHVVQVLEIIENYREIASSLMDVYLSSISNKMNEVMKVLTIISTIFIPLTFIAGVYGMNFNPELPGNMPELELPYAYVVCWLVMLTIAGALILYFKRRGWFDNFSGIKH